MNEERNDREMWEERGWDRRTEKGGQVNEERNDRCGKRGEGTEGHKNKGQVNEERNDREMWDERGRDRRTEKPRNTGERREK